MASKLRKFLNWFRDSQSPRKKSSSPSAPAKPAPLSKEPRYYVFFYRSDQISGNRVKSFKESGWKYPKQYFGPFDTQADAREAIAADLAPKPDDIVRLTPKETRSLRRQYKINRLAPAQFKKIWGVLPGEPAKGW